MPLPMLAIKCLLRFLVGSISPDVPEYWLIRCHLSAVVNGPAGIGMPDSNGLHQSRIDSFSERVSIDKLWAALYLCFSYS